MIGSIEFHKEWNEVVSFTEDCGRLKLFDMRSNKVVMRYESLIGLQCTLMRMILTAMLYVVSRRKNLEIIAWNL